MAKFNTIYRFKAGNGGFSIDFSQLDYEADKSLRGYQIDNKRKIYEAWQRCRAVMLQMPTGTGKTRLFVSIARDLHNYGVEHKRAVRILFLAHRKELIEQISQHVGEKYSLAHGLIVAQNMEQKSLPIQIGSVPTMTRRLERWEDKDFDIIIIDEAHHVKAKSYKKIIDFYPNAKILGVTATPYRLNGAGFHPEFDELIISASVAEFIKSGYLSEYVYYSIKPTSDLQREIDRMKLDFQGDYMEKEMMGVMDRDFIRARILSSYQKFANGKKGIVYTISREHNIHLSREFNAVGIKSAAIDSDTPKEEREKLVSKFRNGEIQVLFNVNIFSEGFDCPDVEVIQLARPTRSLAMYLQQVGRGLRPHETKENLIILDNVGLFNKFGFPSARRKWRYHFEGRPVDESPEAHKLERDEEDRQVRYIFEGNEAVEVLHDSRTEEVGQSILDNIEHDYEKSFVDYTSDYLNANVAQSYAKALRTNVDLYIQKNIDNKFNSVFNLIDQQELKSILEKLRSNPRFCLLNKENHYIFTAALCRYIFFAEWFVNNHNDEMPQVNSEELVDESIIDIDDEKQNRIDEYNRVKSKVINELDYEIISDFNLSDINTFSYDTESDSLEINAGFDYETILRDELDITELTRIMNKLSLELSPVIKEKLKLLEKSKEISLIESKLHSTLRQYVESQMGKDIYIESITYSDDKGISVDINN